MKKILVLLMMAGFCSSALHAETISISSPNPDLIINIRINLHKKPECTSGFGFCRVSIGFEWEDGPRSGSKDLRAQAYLNSSQGLVVKIAESDLRQYENGRSLVYFLGKDKIVLTEDYEIGEDVGKALGATGPLVIKAGEYKITSSQGYFSVIFPQ